MEDVSSHPDDAIEYSEYYIPDSQLHTSTLDSVLRGGYPGQIETRVLARGTPTGLRWAVDQVSAKQNTTKRIVQTSCVRQGLAILENGDEYTPIKTSIANIQKHLSSGPPGQDYSRYVWALEESAPVRWIGVSRNQYVIQLPNTLVDRVSEVAKHIGVHKSHMALACILLSLTRLETPSPVIESIRREITNFRVIVSRRLTELAHRFQELQS